MTHKYWVSCRAWTVEVGVKDGMVVEAAPVVQKFVGQPFGNLLRWADRIGGTQVERLEAEHGSSEEGRTRGA